MPGIIVLVLLVVAIFITFSSIKTVPQGFEYTVQRFVQHFKRHLLGAGPVREVAIIAIDIAERGGLQDEQPDLFHVRASVLLHVSS